MSAWWETLPLTLDPIAFWIGSVSVTWYALMYAAGGAAALFFLFRRKGSPLKETEMFWAMATTVLWGTLIGARLGYVLFYGESIFWSEPWRILSPYDFETGLWTGIRGMSFFGGLLGGLLGLLHFARKRSISFWTLADWIVPAIPIALFFGRMGNFLNGELVGRKTDSSWGMLFSATETFHRHPSQLYEALGEGVALFFVLGLLEKKSLPEGMLTACFLLLYGITRFFLEFFREPDPGATMFFGFLTGNQLGALGLAVFGLWLYQRKKRAVI